MKIITKICTKCGIEKSFSSFSKQKGQRFGLNPRCKLCKKITAKAYRKTNSEKIKTATKKYYRNNFERMNVYSTVYRIAHPEKIKIISKNCYEKKKKDSCFRLNGAISSGIWRSLKGNKNGRQWESLVGYSLDTLIKHLEKQFTKGMTWENYGIWHVDHKIPLNVFNYTKSEHEDFKKCWALENLQPLWAFDNLSKHNKLDKHFQPSLAI